MFKYISTKITNLDIFAYNPESSLLYDMKKQFPTFTGGCSTIFYISMLGVVCCSQLFTMFTYSNNSNTSNTVVADLETVFKVGDLYSIPLYAFSYKNQLLPRYDNKTCSEFNGDCLQYVEKYFDMFFKQIYSYSSVNIT